MHRGLHSTRELHPQPPAFLPPTQESVARARMPNVGIEITVLPSGIDCYPLQKMQLPSLATFFIYVFFKNERLLVDSDSTTEIAMPNMVGNDIQSH